VQPRPARDLDECRNGIQGLELRQVAQIERLSVSSTASKGQPSDENGDSREPPIH
jgi:hypothetical protein